MSTADHALPASFDAGEWVLDLGDPRLAARYPRSEGETDTAYALRLETEGRAVLLSEASMKSGGYPRAWATAVSRGVPVLTPVAKDPPARPPRLGVRDGFFFVDEATVRDPERFAEARAKAAELEIEVRLDEGS